MNMLYILIIGLAPCAALGIYFYRKDKYEKEPVRFLMRSFVGGMLISIVALVIESAIMIFVSHVPFAFFRIFLRAFLVAGAVEEWSKYVQFNSLVYKNKNFNEPFDGILYSVMISLGFATLENLGYVLTSYLKLGFVHMIEVGTFRALFSVPGHACWAVIMGYYFSKARFAGDERLKRAYLSKALSYPVFAHGLFDFLIMTKTVLGFLLFLLFVRLCWDFAFKAINEKIEESPFAPRK